jgi:hypothetical protein
MEKFNRQYDVVYMTNDYEIFKRIEGNRVLNRTKYTQLLKSMEEEQLMIPVIVNEKMEIIDGQHRFSACKELGKPVYYVIARGYGIEEVKRANLVSSNWTTLDYLNLHIANGNSNYDIFADLLENSGLNTSDLIKVFAAANDITSDAMQFLFENGEFKLDNVDKVEAFLAALQDFNYFKRSRKRNFIAAFLVLFFDSRYKHEIMKDRLKKRAAQLTKNNNRSKAGYLNTLANDMYSFGASKNNLFYDEKRNKLYTING